MGVTVKLFLVDLREYDSILLPAYRAFLQQSDPKPLVSLVERALSPFSVQRKRGLLKKPDDVYQEYADILRGKVFYSSTGSRASTSGSASKEDLRLFIDNSVAQDLFMLFCTPEVANFDPEQNMSRTALMQYLYSQSRWIEDYFTFATEPSGPVLDIRLGEWSRLYSADEINEFNDEIGRMPRPSDPEILADGFDNLRSLVKAAATRGKVGLLVSIM